MSDSSPTPSSSPDSTGNGGSGDVNYLTIALVVGIPSSAIILILLVLIIVMFYLMLRPSRAQQEQEFTRRRFQGISLEQQRKMAKKRKKRRAVRKTDSTVSGIFSKRVSRPPSAVSSSTSKMTNPFGLQEWQLRMYSGGTRGDGSPGTEETEISDEDGPRGQGRDKNYGPLGVINPLMIHTEDYDPQYDIPPPLKSSHKPHPPNKTRPHHAHPSSRQAHPHSYSARWEGVQKSGRGLIMNTTDQEEDLESSSSSSDDSMNPYD